ALNVTFSTIEHAFPWEQAQDRRTCENADSVCLLGANSDWLVLVRNKPPKNQNNASRRLAVALFGFMPSCLYTHRTWSCFARLAARGGSRPVRSSRSSAD